jgi:glucan 1,3-beta-glucosidase
VLARREERVSGVLPLLLGVAAITLALLAVQAALGLTFDPRYKDFPFAPLTAGVVPLLVLMFAIPRAAGRRGAAETAFAAILFISAGYIVFNESFSNWQSLWFCAAIAGLSVTLFRARDARD